MVDWAAFEAEAPEIAAAGRRLLTHTGYGMGFLSTVRKDGGPRLHPICPVLAEGGLYGFIVSFGWKYRDLLRDKRYALHSFPLPEGGEEFYITGTARPIDDAEERARVVAAAGGTLGTHDFEMLFRFDIERALYTKWEDWGTPQTMPTFAKWAAP